MVESLRKEERKKEEFDYLNFESDPEINKHFTNSKSWLRLSIGFRERGSVNVEQQDPKVQQV